ncbi:MAG: Ycf66 family protein [Cyanobacteria bacterium P01_D01_bin.156]
MNFGTPVPLLVGLILILGAVGLFFLDKLKPGYERSSDKVYSILLLLSGIFLLAHLNMELLASFQQVMLVGMLTTLIINDISKRDSSRARPAERDVAPPRRYDDRPPRRVYRAELDDWDSPGPRQPRIPSDRYRDGYGDQYQARPLEPQRPPYEDRRPPARLQPGQQPPGRRDGGGGGSYSGPAGPGSYSGGEPQRRYDGGAARNSRPQQPPQRPSDFPPVPSGGSMVANNSVGGAPQQSAPRSEQRPPLNVKPRPEGPNEGSYTDFRPTPPPSSDSDSYPDAPPPQPPVNY